MKPIRSVLAITLALLLASASAGLSQTLEESVRAALDRSPVVKQALERARGAAADIDAAKADWRPQVSTEARGGPAYRDRSIDGVSTGSGDTMFSQQASVSVQQLLFDWGQTGRLVESAQLRRDFQQLLMIEAEEDQALAISNAYLDLIGFRLRAQVLDKKVDFLQEMQRAAADREAKEGNIDMTIIRGRVSSAKSDIFQISSLARALEKRLERLTTLTVKDVDFPALPRTALATANLETSAQYQAAIKALESSERNTEALRRESRPKLFLEARGGLGEDSLGIEGPDNDVSALLVFRWNPYEGGRKRAFVRRAIAEQERDRAAVQEVMDVIEDRVTVAQERLRGSIDRYEELNSAILELSRGQDAVREQVMGDAAAKDTSLLSLVSIHDELSSARGDIVEAYVDQYKSAYAVYAACGKLLEYFGINRGYLAAE